MNSLIQFLYSGSLFLTWYPIAGTSVSKNFRRIFPKPKKKFYFQKLFQIVFMVYGSPIKLRKISKPNSTP